MTRHSPATPLESGGASRRPLSATVGFWWLVAGIIAATMTLTVWATAQAHGVESRLNQVGSYDPHHPSIRQVERADENRARELHRLDEHERQRLSNRHTLSAKTTTPTELELLRLEYSELRRFRNRAPGPALPMLDADINRLRQRIADVADTTDGVRG